MQCKVPVIAVFTKYDQFKRDIRMKLEARSEGNAKVTLKDVDDEAEKIFQDQYWNVIVVDSPRYVRLQSKFHYYICGYLVALLYISEMHKVGEPCDALLTETSNVLSTEVVTLMLLAVQRGNLEISARMAVNW